MGVHILAIDDEEGILRVIRRALEKDGCHVDALSDPLAIDTARLGQYDLILLDVMMPGMDGFSLCRRIRGEVDCPVLFLTAKRRILCGDWGWEPTTISASPLA